MKHLLASFTFFVFALASFSSNISGFIFDKVTREQLVGASVVLQPGSSYSSSNLSGKYFISNVREGHYTIKVSYLGYKTIDTSLIVLTNSDIKLNFKLASVSTTLQLVSVTAKGNKESDGFAERAEEKADNLVNIVSANSIAISPDLTVANVMARMSGVSIERGNGGDGQYAIIRGMDKRYNTTLINGIKIPSPDNKDRYVPLDIFPAELLERIEVTKTTIPSMEGDGTGGVVNLVMKSAPYKLVAEGNVGIGYSSIFQHQDFYKFDWKGISSKSPAETNPGVNSSPSDFSSRNFNTTKVPTPLNSTASLTLGNR